MLISLERKLELFLVWIGKIYNQKLGSNMQVKFRWFLENLSKEKIGLSTKFSIEVIYNSN